MTNECWVGVCAKPQAEGRTALGIGAARLPVFFPVERLRIKLRTGEKYVIIKPLMPGYLFARCDPGRLDRVLEIDGVANVVRSHGRLLHVPDELVAELQRRQDLGEFDRANEVLQDGDSVRIKGGPFAGLIGKIRNARRARDRFEIVVDFIHHMTVNVDKLERVVA